MFRKIQLALTTFLFVVVFLVCWKTTGFKLTEINLSYWGVENGVKWIWNMCLIVLAISTYCNIRTFIKEHNYKFLFPFFIQCLAISLLGVFPMGMLIHDIVAYLYFFTLPLCIFLFATINRKGMKYTEWGVHISLSFCMMLFPLLLYVILPGMALAETLHSLIFIGWNVYILKKHGEYGNV